MPERSTSQEFRDCFDRVRATGATRLSPDEDDLDCAQLQWLALWKDKMLVRRRLLAYDYDATNFYTWPAGANTRNELAPRGHNKPGRHNLRQVSPGYVLDGENGLSLAHPDYPGNIADADGLRAAWLCRMAIRSRATA